ncbi:MAG: AraC family transcriptional regulator [Cryomorphaceae bacterium]|nr:MAG: AraC family transcriptional regulator [Cryomorphaceae bacterium]
MTIYIKHMVSNRCKQKVAAELKRLGIEGSTIQLGRVELPKPLYSDQLEALRHNLSGYGLEVIQNHNEELVQKVKLVIQSMLAHSAHELAINHSEYISDKLGVKYAYLARIFSETTGLSIKQFIINHRIQLTKDLIRKNNQTLTEIAYQLNYSSIGHLSNQFKEVTGFAPSIFKRKTRLHADQSQMSD